MPEAPRRAAPGGWFSRGASPPDPAVAVGSLLLAIPPATSAAGSVTLTTPYPAVAVPPGEEVSFTINVQTDVSDQVDLSVADVPKAGSPRCAARVSSWMASRPPATIRSS